MALDGTYTGLLASVADWTGRTNQTSVIPDAVKIFEAVANRRLKVRQQETSATLTTSGGSVALPTDYLSWRRMTWTGSTGVDMHYRTPSGLRLLFPQFVAGIPSNFSIEGSTIITADQDDTTGAFVFEYFAKISALSSGANWLFTAHPDVYLFGTLCEVYGLSKDAENMATWGSRRNDVFDEIERLDARTRGPSQITIAGATP